MAWTEKGKLVGGGGGGGIVRDPAASVVLPANTVGYDSVGKIARIGDGTTRFDRLPFWQLAMPDITPPAAFTVTATPSQTAIQLAWTESVDDKATVAYVVSVTGQPAMTASLGPDVRAHTLSGLTASTAYAGTVKALDAAGNERVINWSTSTTATPLARGNRTSYIGDSITAYSTDNNAKVYTSAWPTVASILTGQRIAHYANRGVGGEQTSHMDARFMSDIVNAVPQPDVVLIMGGHNDAASGVAPATFIANTRSMVNKAKAAGIFPIVCKPIPHGTATQNNTVLTYCTALDSFGDCPVIDTNTPLRSANGLLNPPDRPAGDNTHPNSLGHFKIGQAVAAAIPTIGVPAARWPDSTAADNRVSKKGTTTRFNGSLATGALNSRGYIDGTDHYYGGTINGVTVSAVANPWGGPGRAVKLAGAPTDWSFGVAWSVDLTGLTTTDRVFLGCRFSYTRPWAIGFNIHNGSGTTIARPMAGDQATEWNSFQIANGVMGVELPRGGESTRWDVAMTLYPAAAGEFLVGELFAFKL